MSLISSIQTKAPSMPSRTFFYAPEKWGKTSFAAYAPKPVCIMTEGETGLLSLIETGSVPETPHFPHDARTWDELISYVTAIRNEPHEYRTLVLDTTNGAERLLVQHVCETQFGGSMSGRDGFASYGRGIAACIPEWTRFLRLLDEIRTGRKMSILLLAHSRAKTVNNPEGADYDQTRPEGEEKLWSLTHKWADIIAAGTYQISVKDDKVKQGSTRVIRTSGSVAVVCGNRYGLPETISCGGGASDAWKNFQAAVVKAKSKGKTGESQPQPQTATATAPTQTPAPEAAPTPAAVPAPEPSKPAQAIPKNGYELYDVFRATEERLCKEGLCEKGEFVQALDTRLADYPADLAQWSVEQIETAVKLCLMLEAQLNTK